MVSPCLIAWWQIKGQSLPISVYSIVVLWLSNQTFLNFIQSISYFYPEHISMEMEFCSTYCSQEAFLNILSTTCSRGRSQSPEFCTLLAPVAITGRL